MKKIAVLIPYFGRFPEWSDLYFETLRRNETIDFIFLSDQDGSRYSAPNIIFHKATFADYVKSVNEKLDFTFQPQNAYKLCDLRPLFGYLHRDIFAPYDFYGWTDMDILFGDIRAFYTDDVLKKYDVISNHVVRVSGHLALFRNTEENRSVFKKIYRWKEALLRPEFVGIDEHGITNALTNTIFDKISQKYKISVNNPVAKLASKIKKRKLYLKEQYTTPFTAIPWTDGTVHSQQPDVWQYKDGVITNQRDADKEFVYLHFMNFKSSLWRHDGTKAPWEGKDRVCFATLADMKTGIVIDKDGIHPGGINIRR
jgi:hypothetical protein